MIPTEPSTKNRLRTLRRARGMPMHELAVRAPVSPSVLGMVERFDYRPGAMVRQRIAKALGVDEGEIWPQDVGGEAATVGAGSGHDRS